MSVEFTVSKLEPNTTYDVERDGVAILQVTTNGDGVAVFTVTVGEAESHYSVTLP